MDWRNRVGFSVWFVGTFLCALINEAVAQIDRFPFLENFDGVAASTLPADWVSSGFMTSATAPKSPPNNLAAAGNTVAKYARTPFVDFTGKIPFRLTFFERRSSTAASYRLEVKASLRDSVFDVLLGTFTSISTTSSYVERVVDLRGRGLDNGDSVRIEWRILPDSTNTTGVLRIDDVSLEVLPAVDLVAARMIAEPELPTSRDQIGLRVAVQQAGVSDVEAFAVEYFRDADSDGRAESGERFASLQGGFLPAGDSTLVEALHPPLPAGVHRFLAVTRSVQDENPANDTAAVLIEVGAPRGSIVINEIMYAPSGDEPEWIELVSRSPDTLDLRYWRISDSNTGSKAVLADKHSTLPPGQFIVVARDPNLVNIRPDIACPVLVVPFAALNNTTPDAVVLYDQRLIKMDSVGYVPVAGVGTGVSLERIDVDEPSGQSGNWAPARDTSGATPGVPNSVTRLDHDLEIASLAAVVQSRNEGRVALITAVVRNAGKLEADGFTLRLVQSADDREGGMSDLLIAELTRVGTLSRGDSAEFLFDYRNPPSGEHSVRGMVEYAPDLRNENNELTAPMTVGYDPGVFVVNEIMYDPLPGQNEWVELVNRGSTAVNVGNWSIVDRAGTSGSRTKTTFEASFGTVKPGDYVVVAAESTVFSFFPHLLDSLPALHVFIAGRPGGLGLGNEGDDLLLLDHTGAVMDSLTYDPSWHNPGVTDSKGRSLERINPALPSADPRNWGTSAVAAGGSPGLRNTLFTVRMPQNGSISVSPNPFSPDGDGYEDVTLIGFSLPMTNSVVRIRIFDAIGRLIRTLADSEPAGSTGEIVWDGYDDRGRRARLGPHILLLEALDGRGGGVAALKAVVVVATKI